MKVWINKRHGRYEGGMIIVAANSAKEAAETLDNDSRFGYMYSRIYDGSLRNRYYLLENWQEVPLLVYNGDKPCVIDEGGYSE